MIRALGLFVLLSLLLVACSAPQLRPAPGAPSVGADPARLIVVTVTNAPSPGVRGAGSTWRGWDVGSAYRVTAETQASLEALARDHALRKVDAWPIDLLGVQCVVFELAPDAVREPVLDQLRRDPRVESAQPLNRFSPALREVRDPPRDLQYSLQTLQIEQAHRWARGRGVRVAVIDTGLDYTHPKLADRVQRRLDLVGRPGDVFEQDRHGTAVAGVIAADDDGAAVVGVAPQAELIALKACWPLQAGSAAAECSTFTLARALAAAVDLQADVLNLSLAGPPDPLLERLVAKALRAGAVVVGAVPETGAAGFPAQVPGVIAVRSSTQAGSADDPAGTRALSAPGEDIISTAPGAGYALSSGSSLATAHVSGVAALLRELRGAWTGAQIEQVLRQSMVQVAGQPSINACVAVTRTLGQGLCEDAGPR